MVGLGVTLGCIGEWSRKWQLGFRVQGLRTLVAHGGKYGDWLVTRGF